MTAKHESSAHSGLQVLILTLLRVAIGWHFLYEGAAKLFSPGWSSAGYLNASKWVLADTFHWMAATSWVLRAVDLMNIWGLILIGAGLMLGVLARPASVCGALLLLLYYVANPPFLASGAVMEGSYLIVDKNLVELCALCVLAAFPATSILGLGRLGAFVRRKGPHKQSSEEALCGAESSPPQNVARREIMKGFATIPFAAAFVLALVRRKAKASFEEKNLVDAVSSATMKKYEFTTLSELKGPIPKAKIKGLELSRLILGGNLIGGWAHARDLIYVSKLVKAYHQEEKIFETFALAEKCGINTILTNPLLCGVIKKYWDRGHGKIQFISDCGGADLLERVKVSIDGGASSCYVQGGVADRLVKEGKIDLIAKALELIRANGLPAGIGGHYLKTIQACVDKGLEPDYWMKTLHPKTYWSATHAQEDDRDFYSIFCNKPDETIAYMDGLKQPWIAFKILGAGALRPEVGFRYAFEGGADFICVGMYDFQIVEDVNLAVDVLGSDLKRKRPWIV